MILQAAMAFGMILMGIAFILVCVVFPLVAVIYANIEFNKVEKLNARIVILVCLKSILISLGITLATACMLWGVLYFTVDLSSS